MFNITAQPEFSHVVAVLVPCDGGHREETLRARFRVVSTDETDTSTMEGIEAFLKSVIVSLDELVDGGGEPVLYNNAVRDQVLALPYARLALLRAYMTAITKAKLGN